MVDVLTGIVSAVENIALGLYILCMAGLLWMAYRLQRARHELAVSQFKLEREHALVRQASAITFGGLLIEVMIAVWAIANVMAPTIREIKVGSEDQGPARVTRYMTMTSNPQPMAPLDTGLDILQNDDVFAAATPNPTAVGTILPDAPAEVGCPQNSAWFDIPGNGQLLFEATTVWGIATTSNFSHYKFEIKPAGAPDTQWSPINSDVREVKTYGPLGDILPWQLPDGEYRFRLTVFNNTDKLVALCEKTIHVLNSPPPSATPLDAPTATPTSAS